MLFSFCSGRICVRTRTHYSDCSHRGCAVSVLMGHFTFALDHRHHLSLYWLWSRLSAGSLCGTTLVQVSAIKRFFS